MFFPISTSFTSTLGIPLSSPELQHDSIKRNSQVEPGAFTPDLSRRLAPFTPSNSEQRSPPSYYRGCWHEVSRGFFSRYRHHRRVRKSFTTLRPSSLTRHCWIRLAPIVQYSPLLPPVGVWAVSQSQCADHPLRPATDHSLGGPLPHQLANPTRAPPRAINLSPSGRMRY